LLKCVNATKIFLVLKVETPTTMNDFRPISCCNMMYKCISKVIMNRSKGIFPEVIGLVQTIFFSGRQISDVILLTQDLIHIYHLVSVIPRCALKIDIRKAVDTVS
jgi:hypothetical protein